MVSKSHLHLSVHLLGVRVRDPQQKRLPHIPCSPVATKIGGLEVACSFEEAFKYNKNAFRTRLGLHFSFLLCERDLCFIFPF